MLDVEIDIFYRDRRVIDEDANRKCQTAKRHDIDGLTESRKRGQRRKDRERNRNGDNECRAPAAKKKKNHETSQRGRDQAFLDHGADGRSNEGGLVAHELHLKAVRH
jgi:hypothetical protein